MSSSSTLIFMVIFFLESLAAMLQNGFMVAVLGREWMRCHTLPSGDMIVACLAASQFCLHGMALLNNLMGSFGFRSRVNYFNISWVFINTLTFWLTAWLATFYCVKISSFFHPIFYWLKWRISQSVPRLLLGSLIISGVTVISLASGHSTLVQMSVSQSSHGNSTLAERIQTIYHNFFLPNKVLVLLIPFLLFLVSTLLLIFSLHWHLQQMRSHRPDRHDPSIQAHIVALRSLAFFLIFYTLYFLYLIIVSMHITTLQNQWHWAWDVVTYAGICLHSSILLLSSPKLRKALKMMLWKTLEKWWLISSYQYQ
ncbi:PREDICTED: taste receptor type 2 member 134-like [Ceratotherium simum simum]|uniref:Taste receptor type 2 n=1 Tax=Ceratotherium simum simum TaxID=73337 RepID=A0ABM0HNR9_CERSS|nr:PREDICTED: taste receptor type 2 member 134-like [Ceratotherium simum simum]